MINMFNVLIKIKGNFRNNVDLMILESILSSKGCKVFVDSNDFKTEGGKSKKYNLEFYSYNYRYIISYLITKNSYIDIRTYPVSRTKLIRWLNILMINIIHLIKPEKVIFQDQLVKQSLIGNRKHFLYAPMGTDASWIIKKKKEAPFDKRMLRIVYHGSLLNRNFNKFFRSLDPIGHKNFEFTFLTDHIDEFEKLHALFNNHFNLKIAKTCSRKELPSVLIKYDIGLSWIDPQSIYDTQVPTKIYDFISLDMPCFTNRTTATTFFFKEDSGVFWYDNKLQTLPFNGYRNRNHQTMQESWDYVTKIMLE